MRLLTQGLSPNQSKRPEDGDNNSSKPLVLVNQMIRHPVTLHIQR